MVQVTIALILGFLAGSIVSYYVRQHVRMPTYSKQELMREMKKDYQL